MPGFQRLVYAKSSIALLNARYYAWHANADIFDPSEFHVRHGVYRPELQVPRKIPTMKCCISLVLFRLLWLPLLMGALNDAL